MCPIAGAAPSLQGPSAKIPVTALLLHHQQSAVKPEAIIKFPTLFAEAFQRLFLGPTSWGKWVGHIPSNTVTTKSGTSSSWTPYSHFLLTRAWQPFWVSCGEKEMSLFSVLFSKGYSRVIGLTEVKIWTQKERTCRRIPGCMAILPVPFFF